MRSKYPRRQPQPHVNTYEAEDDHEDDADEPQDREPVWRIRFNIRSLLILMLFSSVLFAGVGYLLHWIRGGEHGRKFQLIFIMFTLVAPIALLVSFTIVSWILGLRIWHHESTDDDT
jgi:magnesium-transporting ATPase (P-type)